jgi:hypothetical protein
MEPENPSQTVPLPPGTVREYWWRVWNRARGETRYYSVEILTGLVGSSALVLAVVAALYWLMGEQEKAKDWVVTILVIAGAVFICSCAFFIGALIRLPPVMEREVSERFNRVVTGLEGAIREQASAITRLGQAIFYRGQEQLIVDAQGFAGEVLLTVSNTGPEARISARAEVVYSSRMKQSPTRAYDLPWDRRKNRAVAIGLGTHSVLRVAMLEDTHFDLLEWTPNGPSSVAEWLINPILVGSIEDDPRSLVLWLQVTLSYDQDANETEAAAPVVLRYIVEVVGHSRIDIHRVAQWEDADAD